MAKAHLKTLLPEICTGFIDHDILLEFFLENLICCTFLRHDETKNLSKRAWACIMRNCCEKCKFPSVPPKHTLDVWEIYLKPFISPAKLPALGHKKFIAPLASDKSRKTPTHFSGRHVAWVFGSANDARDRASSAQWMNCPSAATFFTSGEKESCWERHENQFAQPRWAYVCGEMAERGQVPNCSWTPSGAYWEKSALLPLHPRARTWINIESRPTHFRVQIFGERL